MACHENLVNHTSRAGGSDRFDDLGSNRELLTQNTYYSGNSGMSMSESESGLDSDHMSRPRRRLGDSGSDSTSELSDAARRAAAAERRRRRILAASDSLGKANSSRRSPSDLEGNVHSSRSLMGKSKDRMAPLFRSRTREEAAHFFLSETDEDSPMTMFREVNRKPSAFMTLMDATNEDPDTAGTSFEKSNSAHH